MMTPSDHLPSVLSLVKCLIPRYVQDLVKLDPTSQFSRSVLPAPELAINNVDKKSLTQCTALTENCEEITLMFISLYQV